MAILAKLQKHGPVAASEILGLFTTRESEAVYPPLSPVMVAMLTEELHQMGYVGDPATGSVAITPRGVTKLTTFKGGLPPEHRAAFDDCCR